MRQYYRQSPTFGATEARRISPMDSNGLQNVLFINYNPWYLQLTLTWQDNFVKKKYFTIHWWPISWDEMYGAVSLMNITLKSHVPLWQRRNAKGKRSWQLNCLKCRLRFSLIAQVSTKGFFITFFPSSPNVLFKVIRHKHISSSFFIC